MDKDNRPKKNFLSLQTDLSMFEPATEEEKRQQDRMRESTSFFKDGMRRLRKNVVAMICLGVVVTLALTAFIVPLFYPYDYASTSASRGSYSATYMQPFEYSTRELIIKEKSAVFIGWSYPNTEDKYGYYGLKVIDSKEYLDKVKHLFVTDSVQINDSSVQLYAVWSVDKDGDGVADFGADMFDYSSLASTSVQRYKVTYHPNGGEGTVPTDDNLYAPSDRIGIYKPTDLTKAKAVFYGWSTEALETLTADNYATLKSVIAGRTGISQDTTLYAVWAQDEDGDGAVDFKVSTYSYYSPKINRYRVYYNLNLGKGDAPIDATEYAEGDKAAVTAESGFTKETKDVFPHLLGTDEIGRDYAIRVVVGMRVSLMVGIIAAVIVVIIGVLYGAISGYFGGKVDLVMMRIVDIIYSLPDTLIIILLSLSLRDILQNSSSGFAEALGGVGLVSILIVFALLYWVGMARLVRGQVLSLREQEFVLAAKAMGVSPMKIIFKHMLPNCISVIFISAALQIPSAIFTESFLSFLGVGVSIPMPSLGSLASDYRGQMTITDRSYLFIIPAICIFLIVLSLNLLGQGLRDAFDPKLRKEEK